MGEGFDFYNPSLVSPLIFCTLKSQATERRKFWLEHLPQFEESVDQEQNFGIEIPSTIHMNFIDWASNRNGEPAKQVLHSHNHRSFSHGAVGLCHRPLWVSETGTPFGKIPCATEDHWSRNWPKCSGYPIE